MEVSLLVCKPYDSVGNDRRGLGGGALWRVWGVALTGEGEEGGGR